MKIYDCFTFYNEVDLLKVRLDILNPYVNKFVIVELNKTHRGVDKELNFKNHIEEFEQYMDKIIYITPDNIPEYNGDGDWTIENFQRNSIMLGLEECEPDDIIMVSDLDEIPNPIIFERNNNIKYTPPKFKQMLCGGRKQAIKFLIHNILDMNYKNKHSIKIGEKNWMDLLDCNRFVCAQGGYYYYMNCKRNDSWFGTTISKYKNMISPQDMRNKRFAMTNLEDAGWHFSYLGGVERIKQKLASIIDNRKEINDKMRKCKEDDDYIIYCMKNGISIFDDIEKTPEYHFIGINDIGIDNVQKIKNQYPDFFYLENE